MRLKAKEGLIQPFQEINIVDDEYFMKTTIGHISTEVRFKLGVTFPSSSMDGKKIMVIGSLSIFCTKLPVPHTISGPFIFPHVRKLNSL